MSYLRDSEHDITSQNERLARAFISSGRFIPHFLGVTGIGFLAIYIFTRSGIFGQPSPSLVYMGVITILLALVQIFLLSRARRNMGAVTTLWSAAATGVFAILLTYFWQGITPLSILIAIIAPVNAGRVGVSRRFFSILSSITLLAIAGILYAENTSTFDRLQSGTPASIAGIAFLIATGILLATITVISENRNFKKLQNLLLASFVVIVTIPTIMAAVLSATGTISNSQTQTFNTLKTISNLKESQLSALIQGHQDDARKLQINSGFARNALDVLMAKEVDPVHVENSKRLAREHMENISGAGEEYNEVMVLNTQGEVLISTMPQSEGGNFEEQLFFRQGTLRFYTGFADVAAFGSENLIVATPIFDTDGRVIRGVLAFRSAAESIKEVMENTPGFEEAETYLVDRSYKPITKTRTSTDIVSTHASLEALVDNVSGGQDIYENYEKQPVLGYYEWFESMQVAIIAEVPLNTVVINSAKPLIGSAVLSLFIIAMAIAAVAIAAHSIVHPITILAQTTESFAAGKLSARAPIERQDEIGALANSYNQMAAQLQEIIGRLEQRVNDRTRDLENQTLHLRWASEIARDAASARSLGELLDRSAQLISDRFGFYHTGIFLIDRDKEYAVLVSTSSAMGKQMIENNYRLRVGDDGTVGRVAAAGEPRIIHETDEATVAFNSPILPGTRSEMALPLKADNSIIGVLDIQSDKSQAFSEDDIAIMGTMADQLATAIERTQLLQEVENSLKELESAYGRYTRDGWNQLIEDTHTGSKGYRFDNVRMEPIVDLPELEKDVLKAGRTLRSSEKNADKQTTVAIPVKLRGQTIGVISVRLTEDHADETVSTIELASERLASALESARLYEEARLRADREQTISQVATAISSSATYEDILQTTVREIGLTLKDAEVSIQITDDTNMNQQNG
jgi:GAF domain-containing protein